MAACPHPSKQIVPLGAQDREPALLNGTVDAVLNSEWFQACCLRLSTSAA